MSFQAEERCKTFQVGKLFTENVEVRKKLSGTGVVAIRKT